MSKRIQKIALLAEKFAQLETTFLSQGWHIFKSKLKDYLIKTRDLISDPVKAKNLWNKIQIYKADSKVSAAKRYENVFQSLEKQLTMLEIFIKNLTYLRDRFPEKYEQWFDTNLVNVINDGLLKNLKNVLYSDTFEYTPFTLYVDNKTPEKTEEKPESGY